MFRTRAEAIIESVFNYGGPTSSPEPDDVDVSLGFKRLRIQNVDIHVSTQAAEGEIWNGLGVRKGWSLANTTIAPIWSAGNDRGTGQYGYGPRRWWVRKAGQVPIVVQVAFFVLGTTDFNSPNHVSEFTLDQCGDVSDDLDVYSWSGTNLSLRPWLACRWRVFAGNWASEA